MIHNASYANIDESYLPNQLEFRQSLIFLSYSDLDNLGRRLSY